MLSVSQKRAIKNYTRKNIRQYVVKLNKATDEKLIEYFESLENIQGKVKEVMTQEMNTKGIKVYVRGIANDMYEIKFNSNMFADTYNEIKGEFVEDDLELYFIKRSELSDELKKIVEYVGTNELNIIYNV